MSIALWNSFPSQTPLLRNHRRLLLVLGKTRHAVGGKEHRAKLKLWPKERANMASASQHVCCTHSFTRIKCCGMVIIQFTFLILMFWGFICLSRIATKTLDQTFCNCLDILFDIESGQHRVQQHNMMEHSNFDSGTKISLFMPMSSEDLSYGEVFYFNESICVGI